MIKIKVKYEKKKKIIIQSINIFKNVSLTN